MSTLDPLRVDPGAPSPLYLQLADRISDAIAARRLREGEALPPERALVERLGLSRTTVRRAVTELAARGLVDARQGSGTFVATRLDQPLAWLSSFTEDSRARGRTPGATLLDQGVRFPSPDESVALSLGAGEQVTFLLRVRLADGEPLALEQAVVPARLLPDPALASPSLYAALEASGAAPVRALQRLRAERATAEQAQHLGIAPGSPVMATVRHGYAPGGTPVEFTRSTYRGDRYDFVAEMRRE